MSDPRITAEAVEAAAKAIYETPHDSLSSAGLHRAPRDIQKLYLAEAEAALEAALPHLAPQPGLLEEHRCTDLEPHKPHTWAYEATAFVCDGGAEPVEQWWITTGPFTDPLCQKIAGPFASRDEAIDNRVRIEAYTTPVTFWVDSPEAAERRANGGQANG